VVVVAVVAAEVEDEVEAAPPAEGEPVVDVSVTSAGSGEE
jgi:hypothetical protein